MSNAENIALPKFLVVGTAKAGTTSVFRYLQQHPDISIPVKETFFFLNPIYSNNTLPYPQQRPKEDLVLDEETYYNIYKNQETQVIGEIGTGYLYHHDVAIPLIQKHLGRDVKIIIILRDPIERTYSSYKHFVKDLHEQDSLEKSLKNEKIRSAENWDFMWHHKAMSCYAEQVRAYLANFPNVKVMFYEDLNNDAEKFMTELYDFIGVLPPHSIDYQAKFNTSGSVRSKWLQHSITQESNFKKIFRPLFRAVFGKERRDAIRKYVKNKNMKAAEQLTDSQRQLLSEFFAADIQELQELLGVELPWKNTTSHQNETHA